MAFFDIKNKVALITGGASGLGLKYAKELLKKGAKGVGLADLSTEAGKKALEEIEEEFGKNKAIFIKTDVCDYKQFEEAFKATIKAFNNLDILINNAGILNDAIWEKEIQININGTIHGMLLAVNNYLPKFKSSDEAVILNISSIAGVAPFAGVPIYSATKFAVHGLTLSWGLFSICEKTKVRIVAVCPGATGTPLLENLSQKCVSEGHVEPLAAECEVLDMQSPDELAPHVITIIEKAPSGTVWVAEGGRAPFRYQMPDRFNMPKIVLE